MSIIQIHCTVVSGNIVDVSYFCLSHLCLSYPQVIAIVMDMFTDVDILHDILNAAMRNVAVYVLLDEQNTHHFINMIANCRVSLQSFQVRACYLEKKLTLTLPLILSN